MKILHTADVHLKEYGDRRWKALEELLEKAGQEKAGIVAISGDLFDQNADVIKLQDHVRQCFSGRPFTIVIISGNHDWKAYSRGIYLGENAVLLSDWQKPYIQDDVVIWGLPFEPLPGVEILNRLQSINSKLTAGKHHYLLFHGELLDAFFSRRELGEEADDRYMPVKLSYFDNLKFEHILAGHLHSGFRVWPLDEKRYFVYPGSPVSITTRETGRRKANLFEAGGGPREYMLDTHHYEERKVKLDPYAGSGPLEQVEKALEGLHPAAEVLLTVTGYFNSAGGLSETELAARIESCLGERAADRPALEYRDISEILDDEIFKTFNRKLVEAEEDARKQEEILDLAVKAMMEARLCK